MKTINVLTILFIFLSFPAIAQENPYPLSQEQIEQLFQENKKITDQFAGEKGYSQKKLSSMSKKDREAFMIAKARQLTLIYGPAYYRDYKEPVIEQSNCEDKKEKCYKIKFFYDPSQEKLWGDYAAIVTFLDSGQALSIYFGGNKVGIGYPNLERYKNSNIMQIKYQPAIIPNYDLNKYSDSLRNAASQRKN